MLIRVVKGLVFRLIPAAIVTGAVAVGVVADRTTGWNGVAFAMAGAAVVVSVLGWWTGRVKLLAERAGYRRGQDAAERVAALCGPGDYQRGYNHGRHDGEAAGYLRGIRSIIDRMTGRASAHIGPQPVHATPHLVGGFCRCSCDECHLRLSRACVCEDCVCDDPMDDAHFGLTAEDGAPHEKSEMQGSVAHVG